jgi:stage III sporulation protein AF
MFLALKNWIISIVVIIMVLSLVDIILPKNSIKKYAKLVMGLIVIIIIITPIFNLFDRKTDINKLVSDYMVKYDTKSIQDTKKSNVVGYNADTISVFKENLKNEIEKSIYDNLNKKYKVIEMEINEDQKSPQFLEVIYIELKTILNENKIEVVSKITINSNDTDKNYFWDKDVANNLKNKFNIESSAIKFIK